MITCHHINVLKAFQRSAAWPILKMEDGIKGTFHLYRQARQQRCLQIWRNATPKRACHQWRVGRLGNRCAFKSNVLHAATGTEQTPDSRTEWEEGLECQQRRHKIALLLAETYEGDRRNNEASKHKRIRVIMKNICGRKALITNTHARQAFVKKRKLVGLAFGENKWIITLRYNTLG